MNLKQKVEAWQLLKDANSELNAQVKLNTETMANLEREILEDMENGGMDKISVNGYTFTKSEKLLPTIMDFEALIKFMAESGNTALLQRRVGQKAFQEFFESYGFYPEGLDAHITTVLSARKG
jgi:maltose-binding protein MalE